MRRTDFAFDLPPELIAQHPLEPRSSSRLLVLDKTDGQLTDAAFADLDAFLQAGDLLVFNDTKVIKARLFGRKESGGKTEILIERVLNHQEALAQVRSSRSPRKGSRILVGQTVVRVCGREGDFFLLNTDPPGFDALLEEQGHVPLPPYISREDLKDDARRYQTLYAREPGAVAAPTAGLHFDQPLFERLQAKGINRAFVTLHVGAGTFQPMRADNVVEHQMHRERVTVSEDTCAMIAATRASGSRVVAVGTTSVRSLESAFDGQSVRPFSGETDLFIYPGKKVHSIDRLITNFHLPESTLLMMVCAFAGTENTMAAYRHAVEQRYRFFSYGDAMLIGDFNHEV